MIHIRVRTADGACRTDASWDELPPLVAQKDALLWLDLESPTKDEIDRVGALLGWEQSIIAGLGAGGRRAELEHDESAAHLALNTFEYAGDPPRLRAALVDFFIGPNYVASMHQGVLRSLREGHEVQYHLTTILGKGAGYLLYVLADHVVDGYFPVLDAIDDAIDELEDRVITSPSDGVMTRIFQMKRDVIDLRKAVSPEDEALARLVNPALDLVNSDQATYFHHIQDRISRAVEEADSYRDLLSGTLDAYLSTISNRMNEVMKRLTLLTAIFLPATFLTGAFGMNLKQPLWSDPSFWLLLVLMALIGLGEWLYFRRKGWV